MPRRVVRCFFAAKTSEFEIFSLTDKNFMVLKLHIKTALLASAVAIAVLLVALLVVSVSIVSRVREEQKQLAQLEAENLAENLSSFHEQINAGDKQQLTNFVSGSRPDLVSVRIWKYDGQKFSQEAASDDSLPTDGIPPETQAALVKGSASQIINEQKATSDSLLRVFVPVVVGGKFDGAVEVVESLDTVYSIASRYLVNLSWIAAATIILMMTAFYLLFQSVVYQPLDKLLTAMEAAETGNLAVELDEKNKPDELGLLAEGFNSMMSQIREMTFERARQTEILQEKVGEATSELQKNNVQLETANLELFQTTRKMSEMERLAAAGQTAAQFAHEVGTPLNLISGHVQLLQASLAPDSKESKRLETISTQIERIEHIVRGMLDRTRFGASEHLPVNLNDSLKKILDAVEPTLQKNNVRLITDLSENLPAISGDDNRLQQVFLNLVNNALDAMPEGGELNISTRVKANKINVEFADSGAGMDEATGARIFQPLFTTKKRGHGTGLGLVVVKQILQEHEAEIEVESELGKGTKFHLSFDKI